MRLIIFLLSLFAFVPASAAISDAFDVGQDSDNNPAVTSLRVTDDKTSVADYKITPLDEAGGSNRTGKEMPDIDLRPALSPVPVSAAVWLVGAALLGLFGYLRRKARA